MRNAGTAVLFLAILTSSHAFAQDASGDKVRLVSFNPVGFLGVGSYSLEYEQTISRSLSVHALGSYVPGRSWFTLAGSSLGGGARLYFSGNAPQEWFIGPEVHVLFTSLQSDTGGASPEIGVGYAFGGIAGYNWFINRAVSVCPLIGAVRETISGSSRVVPFVRLNVGVSL